MRGRDSIAERSCRWKSWAKHDEKFRRRVVARVVRFSPRPLEFALAPHDDAMVNVGRDTRGCEFTEPLKNRGRTYFFVDHRDLTGCRYYVVGHCCRSPGPVHRFTLARSLSLSFSLSQPRVGLSSPQLPSLLSRRTSPRSLTRRSPILYLLYRRDQSRRIPRACAARNERSPVSCLSFRPSVQRTGRPLAFHTPYSSLIPSREISLRASLPSPPPRRFCPLFFARLGFPRYSISSSRHWRYYRPGHSSIPRCTRTKLHLPREIHFFRMTDFSSFSFS